MSTLTSTSSAAALAALEPYLLLAKNARGAAAAKLIEQATSAPGCYVFSELLDVEGIKALASSPEYEASYRLLDIFAFGTYQDYLSAASSSSSSSSANTAGTQSGTGTEGGLPVLNEAQRTKLQRLTLVTLASRARVLAYDELAAAVGIVSPGAESEPGPSSSASRSAGAGDGSRGGPSTITSASTSAGTSTRLPEHSVRELEDLIIEAIYAGILSGKLNQQQRRFEVEGAMGRDVRGAAELGQVAAALEAWSNQADAVLAQLSQRIVDARASARRAAEMRAAHEGEVGRVLAELYEQQASAGAGSSANAKMGAGDGAGRKAGTERRKGGGVQGEGEEGGGDAMDVDPDELALALGHHGRSRKKNAGGLARLKRSRV